MCCLHARVNVYSCCPSCCDLQAIVQMARAADKDGSRTIGVLTKADTIEPGTHNNWLKVLQGQHYPLRLGYYCVVNPSQVNCCFSLTPASNSSRKKYFPLRKHCALVAQTRFC